MRFKKLLAASLAAAMVLPLTGCGSSSDTTKLTVWAPAEDQDKDQGNWLNTICEKFDKEHDEWEIDFEYGTCSEGDAGKTIAQDAEAAADVYMFANDQLGTLIDAGAISKLGGDTAKTIKDTNSQAIVDTVSVDGDIYGVPFTTNTWFMYYDKSAFSETDVASLDAMVEKAKVAFPMSNSWYSASYFVANGGTLFGDGTDGSAGIDFGGDKGIQTTNYLVDLMANPNFVDDADGSGLAGLRDGSIKAIFSGSWDAAAVKKALGDNFGAIKLPTVNINGEAKQLKSFAGSKAIGVNPNSENQEVAVALASYLGGKDAQEEHYKLRNIIPCNTELLATDAIKNDALVTAQNETFEQTSIIQPFISEMGQFWDPTETFGKALVNGEITKANAQTKLDDYVKGLNTAVSK